jgi:hypothetical protein
MALTGAEVAHEDVICEVCNFGEEISEKTWRLVT